MDGHAHVWTGVTWSTALPPGTFVILNSTGMDDIQATAEFAKAAGSRVARLSASTRPTRTPTLSPSKSGSRLTLRDWMGSGRLALTNESTLVNPRGYFAQCSK